VPVNETTTNKHQWFADEMVWKRRKGRARTWTAENPPLPDWAKASGGGVPPAQFVRLYTAADSMSTLKSQLFWLSLGEIEAFRLGISLWLSHNGIQPLAPLDGSGTVLSEEDLSAMLTEGLLSPIPGSALDLKLNPPPELEEGELDLTPTPPRPDEDPLKGKTFNEIMHMPEPSGDRQMVTMMGMGKVRMSAKH
jgi:hypothetical protein